MRGTGPFLAILLGLSGPLGLFPAMTPTASAGPAGLPTTIATLLAPTVRDGHILHRVKTCKFTENSLQPLPCQEDDTADSGGGGGDGTPTPPGNGTAPTRSFAYHPPGKLHGNDIREGRTGDRRVYLPDLVFPIDLGSGQHPHMNSQIYGYGGGGWGGNGAPGGTECDTRNYDPFQQRDNFCEVRSWPMPFCPSGSGHQGQDIRPPSCANRKWMAVAAADGLITKVSSFTTVRLKGDDGTVYEYLHLHPSGMRVKQNQRVEKGDPIGYVSNIMGGKRGTTLHLHFAVRQNVEVNGRVQSVYVPVYTSLIAALRRAKGLGPSVDSDGNLIVDANFEIGAEPVVVPDPTPTPDPVPQPDPGDTPQPPAGDPDDLAAAKARIVELEGELNELKVRMEREVAAAQDEARDARTELRQTEEKLSGAETRIDALEAEVRSAKEAGDARANDLKRELDQAAVTLAQVRAELEALKAEKASEDLWKRTKNWIESIWKGRS
jgi:hypothetical protein